MELTLTRHAREVMAERNVSIEEIEEVVRHPQVQYRTFHRHTPQRVLQRGDLAVVLDGNENIVITVLWRMEFRWSSDQMRGR